MPAMWGYWYCMVSKLKLNMHVFMGLGIRVCLVLSPRQEVRVLYVL